jgi:cellulose synthase/poly-beta-1,6-N-acetylglucosamine synthase-like glycosyltransferase/spore germination protein YaaH/peptidoglycan/xylan/chitin deacetylase (PgdA/CDA1 family)
MYDNAVFFDPTRRRWWWIKRIGTIAGLAVVVAASLTLISLEARIVLPGIEGITAPLKRQIRRTIHLPRHTTAKLQYLAKKDRTRLLDAVATDNRRKRPLPPPKTSGIVAAFYAPWQETGLNSLRANAGNMTHVLPSWVHLTGDGKGLDFRDWYPDSVPHNNDVVRIAREANLKIVPVLQNAQVVASGSGEFDKTRVHLLLTDPQRQANIIEALREWCVRNQYQGINVDFESLDGADYALLPQFLQRMKTSFDGNHLSVSADLEASAPPGTWRAVSSICDFVVVMAYDEHSSQVGKPGPIASMGWYHDVLNRAAKNIPREKLVIGLANYAYDWMDGRDWADPLTYQGALLKAQTYRVVPFHEKPEDVVDFDDEALNPTFWYTDDDGHDHEVWLLDAVTAANQWMLAQNYAPRGVAIWVLGSNDPTIWNFIHRDKLNVRPDLAALRQIKYPYDIEFVGDGEIAHVDSTPKDGSRQIEIDPRTGLALDEDYHEFATSFVISRSGYKEKTIALTIDDGPASPYTAQMLDELKAEGVHATFFLIGQNAERYPNLVKRIWREGHEIGNHTFTHPNIGAASDERTKLELNATQRVFQSLIRRSTLLFRPPYNADAEPTAFEEVRPLVNASQMNYVTVLEFIDPQDWNTVEHDVDGKVRHRTAEEMLKLTLAQLETEKGNCILLHDGGGDRTETVRLIPMLIRELRQRGYKFVTVSSLMNSTRDIVNPPVAASDTLLLANDRVVFELIYLLELFLGIAFVTAIILGALRVVFVTVLALVAKLRERRAKFDLDYRPSVSVVIAAFNEEKVIASTIRAVLAGRYEPLEIIVVDDGSKDDTYGEVLRNFGSRVKLIRQDNAGKAPALNRGIAEATGEILVSLDADTIFNRDTIPLLVRHFADPLVGGVAGNVKVGNRMNPLTYWQSIEYITSQNLDRRAYATINSVTVVPGAVGAWRREAIVQAGGYLNDTMAEDMDLTWRVRRIGWKVATDSDAIGYTEAPDSFRALFKQRFRWAFGTLQSLWKHRRAIGRYGWFGRVMLPTLWLFQVVFQALSPLVDLQILWTLINVVRAWLRGRLSGDWQPLPNALASLYLILFMYGFFFTIELIGSAIAFRLDRESPKPLVWLLWQRFLYRQLMYAVLLKSLKTAFSGIRAGWGKLERKGTVVEIAAASPDALATAPPPSS